MAKEKQKEGGVIVELSLILIAGGIFYYLQKTKCDVEEEIKASRQHIECQRMKRHNK